MALIYLSSTYEDLKEYRLRVYEALHNSGHEVIAMEGYVATDKRPVEKCLADLKAVDIYVGLFAFRYGYIPPSHHNNPDELSITELELREAERLGKYCLIFLADEMTPCIPQAFMDARTGEGSQGRQIEQLRDYLKREKTVRFFSAPDRLASNVQSAVAKYLGEGKPPGKTKGQESGDVVAPLWDIEKLDSPYPGLGHFTRYYAPVFFGREEEVQAILDRMHGPEGRFIIISGDSGVGKSSVVDAGLLPALETGKIPDLRPSCSVHMVPSQGQQPFDALLRALGSLINQAGLDLDKLLNELTQAPETLGQQITAIMKASAASRAPVLFIDQMEELFTAHDTTRANEFLTALYQAATECALWVISTIRSDHLHYCHRHPEMLKVLNGRGHYALGPVNPDMLNAMIKKPADVANLEIAEPFVKRLIRDTEAESGNLPLLAFMLDRLFKERTGHVLSEEVYDRLGRLTGAIGIHVKQVEADIEKELRIKVCDVLPVLFHSLAKVQKEEGIPTRNRSRKTDFEASLRPVIDLLVTNRLLRTEGEGEDATISISHEELFESWPALKEYVSAHKKALMDRTQLEIRANKWASKGKPPLTGLATGWEYDDFQQAGKNVGGLVKEFLQASRWARQFWMGVGLVVLLFLIGIVALWQVGYTPRQVMLKAQSIFINIHQEPDMVDIPEGDFNQGEEKEGAALATEHRVKVKSFRLGIREVTFEEYDRYAISEWKPLPADQGWGRGRRPVINVSWEDAKAYAKWLSEKTSNDYRLPTESEWEYAARSGDKQEVWAGTSNGTELASYAVYASNSGDRTAVVGTKKPNFFGLYDLSGNVFEWVEDCADDDYKGVQGVTWLKVDKSDCKMRGLRGGSWDNKSVDLRAFQRGSSTAGSRSSHLGFRLAQDRKH